MASFTFSFSLFTAQKQPIAKASKLFVMQYYELLAACFEIKLNFVDRRSN